MFLTGLEFMTYTIGAILFMLIVTALTGGAFAALVYHGKQDKENGLIFGYWVGGIGSFAFIIGCIAYKLRG